MSESFRSGTRVIHYSGNVGTVRECYEEDGVRCDVDYEGGGRNRRAGSWTLVSLPKNSKQAREEALAQFSPAEWP